MDSRTYRRLRKREPLIRERLAACPNIAHWGDLGREGQRISRWLQNDPALRRLLQHLPDVALDLVLSDFLGDLRQHTRRLIGDQTRG